MYVKIKVWMKGDSFMFMVKNTSETEDVKRGYMYTVLEYHLLILSAF